MYRLIPVLLFALVFSFSNCSGSSSAAEEEETTQSENNSDDPMTSAANSLRQAADQLEKMEESDEEPISYKELKAMMPDKLLGMDRSNLEGSKSGAMGFTVSQASATYKEDDKKIEVTMVDATGLGIARASMAAWLTIEIDKESDDGYERTTTIDGQKAFEEYDRSRKRGKLSIFAHERIIVNLEGRNVEEGDLRKALDKLDIRW